MFTSSDESSDSDKNTTNFSLSDDRGNFCSRCKEIFPDFFTTVNHHCLPHKCKLCDKKFQHDFQLKFHVCSIDDINKEESTLKCKFCDVTFQTSNLLEVHESSCYQESEQCNSCVLSSPNKKCECKFLKKKCNGVFESVVSYDDSILFNESSDQFTDIISNSNLKDLSMDTKKRKKNGIASSISNFKDSVVNQATESQIKDNLHFSGKFKKSERLKRKTFRELSKLSDDNCKKFNIKTKKLNCGKKQTRNSEIVQDEQPNVLTESCSTTVSDIVPELDMTANQEVTRGKIKSRRSTLKKPVVMLPDVQKLNGLNLDKGNIIESYDRHSKRDFINQNLAESVKTTLESNTNITFNGIHSSHSPESKNKCQLKKQGKKNFKKRKTTIELTETAAHFHSAEKDESDFNTGSRASSPAKRKTRQTRCSSREHDSNVETATHFDSTEQGERDLLSIHSSKEPGKRKTRQPRSCSGEHDSSLETATHFHTTEKDESDPSSIHSIKSSLFAKRKTRQPRSCSQEHDSNLETAAHFHTAEKGESDTSSIHSVKSSLLAKRKTNQPRSRSREHDSSLETAAHFHTAEKGESDPSSIHSVKSSLLAKRKTKQPRSRSREHDSSLETAAHFHTAEKGESDPSSIHSVKSSLLAKRKTKQPRSCSGEHDSSLETAALFHTAEKGESDSSSIHSIKSSLLAKRKTRQSRSGSREHDSSLKTAVNFHTTEKGENDLLNIHSTKGTRQSRSGSRKCDSSLEAAAHFHATEKVENDLLSIHSTKETRQSRSGSREHDSCLETAVYVHTTEKCESDLLSINSVKNTTKRKTMQSRSSSREHDNNVETTAHFHTTEQVESDILSNRSSRGSSPAKRKTRQSRSSSREHDSGLGSLEMSPSSSNNSNIESDINCTRNKKIPSRVPVINNSVKELNCLESNSKKDVCETNVPQSKFKRNIPSLSSLLSKSKKDDKKEKSTINDSSKVSNIETQQITVELEVSESTLNDVSYETSSTEKCNPRLKEDFHMTEIKVSRNAVKTESSIELGDLLNALPPGSSILLKAPPGSFHDCRCPKCNKLFKYSSVGSSHLNACEVAYNANILINYDEIYYVCNVCRYITQKKSNLNHHKRFCIENKNKPDPFVSSNKQLNDDCICPKCSFSCVSKLTFDKHPCTQRLEYMKTCIVKLEPLNCEIIPDRQNISNDSTNCAMPDATQTETAANAGKRTDQTHGQKKTIILTAKPCNTADDAMKNLVNPLAEIQRTLDPEHATSADLKFDMTIPFHNQKTLLEACKDFFENLYTSSEIENSSECDSEYSNFNPQSSEAVNLLKNFACKCRNRILNSEDESKPCMPCLNAFLKEHVLTDAEPQVAVQVVKSDSSDIDELATNMQNICVASTSNSEQSIPMTIDLQQNTNIEVHCINASSSQQISDTNSKSSSSTNLLSSTVSHIAIPVENQMTISADIHASSTSDDSVALSSTVTISSVDIAASDDFFPKLPHNASTSILADCSDPGTSHSLEFSATILDDELLCASPDHLADLVTESSNTILDDIARNYEDIEPVNQETLVHSVDPFTETLNFDIESSINQTLNANSVQNNSGLSASSNESSGPLIIQRNKYQIACLPMKYIVSCDDLKMTVLTPLCSESSPLILSSEQGQTMLIDLLIMLKDIITETKNIETYKQALTIISENQLNVDLTYQSSILHIHYLCIGNVFYNSFVSPNCERYCCLECCNEYPPPEFIRHIYQEHNSKEIGLNVLNLIQKK